MVNKADLNILVSNVVSENQYSHCRLCLKELENSSYVHMDHYVPVGSKEDNFLQLSEVLTTLLREEVRQGIKSGCKITVFFFIDLSL